MPFSKSNELKNNFTSIDMVNEEIFDLKKKLLELRITKKTYQLKKSHQFKQYRKQIAQLNFLKNTLAFNNKDSLNK